VVLASMSKVDVVIMPITMIAHRTKNSCSELTVLQDGKKR